MRDTSTSVRVRDLGSAAPLAEINVNTTDHSCTSSSSASAYALLDYDIVPVTVVKHNVKSVTVAVPPYKGRIAHRERIAHSKVVDAGTPFCVVWERWKGRNGRGAHRIETTMYPELTFLGPRSSSFYVWEDEPGKGYWPNASDVQRLQELLALRAHKSDS